MSIKFSNNLSTTISVGISDTDTSLTVVDASGYPDISAAADYCYTTLYKLTDGTIYEIVKVTSISGNVLTIERGQDGTSGLAWLADDGVQMRYNKASIEDHSSTYVKDLGDTPSGGYTGEAGNSLVVNSTEDGVEYTARQPQLTANLVVSVDYSGGGDYTNLQAAFDAVAPYNPGPYTITINVLNIPSLTDSADFALYVLGGSYAHVTIDMGEDTGNPDGTDTVLYPTGLPAAVHTYVYDFDATIAPKVRGKINMQSQITGFLRSINGAVADFQDSTVLYGTNGTSGTNSVALHATVVSTINARTSNVSGAYIGYKANNSSILFAQNGISECTLNGCLCTNQSELMAVNVDFVNGTNGTSPLVPALSKSGSYVDNKNQSGSQTYAKGQTNTSGDEFSKTPNVIDGDGIIYDSDSVEFEGLWVRDGDIITPAIGGDNLTIEGDINVDTINESTANNGVNIEGVLLKDSNIIIDFDKYIKFGNDSGSLANVLGWYHFNTGSGTNIIDSSGNNNDFIMYGSPAWNTTDPHLGASNVEFFNNTDYLSNAISDSDLYSFEFTDSFTFEGWVRVKAVAAAARYLLSKGTSSIGYGICIKANGNLEVELNVNGASRAIRREVNFDFESSLNNWHYISVTYDGSTTLSGLVVKIDDTIYSTASSTDNYSGGDTLVTTQDFQFSGVNGSNSAARDIDLDEWRVHDEVLSDSEITIYYNSGTGTENIGLSSLELKAINDPVSQALELGFNGTPEQFNFHKSGQFSLSIGAGINEFSTDGTLSGNSDIAVPTEKAVKTYVDGAVSTWDEVMHNGNVFTAVDTENLSVEINQNDVTNNPAALIITNTGTGNDITAPNFSLANGDLGLTGDLTLDGNILTANSSLIYLSANEPTAQTLTIAAFNAGAGAGNISMSATTGLVNVDAAYGVQFSNYGDDSDWREIGFYSENTGTGTGNIVFDAYDDIIFQSDGTELMKLENTGDLTLADGDLTVVGDGTFGASGNTVISDGGLVNVSASGGSFVRLLGGGDTYFDMRSGPASAGNINLWFFWRDDWVGSGEGWTVGMDNQPVGNRDNFVIKSFYNQTIPEFMVTKDGKVAINKEIPTVELDVVGDAAIAGDLNVIDSNITITSDVWDELAFESTRTDTGTVGQTAYRHEGTAVVLIQGQVTDEVNHYGALEFYVKDTDGLSSRLTIAKDSVLNGTLNISDTQAGDLMNALKLCNNSSTAGTATAALFATQDNCVAKGGIFFQNTAGDANGRGTLYIANDAVDDANPVQIGDAAITIASNKDVTLAADLNIANGDINLASNNYFNFGDSNELQLNVGTTDVQITGNTGDMYLETYGGDLNINAENDDVYITSDYGAGDIYLYGDVSISGSVGILDNEILNIGTGNDLQITHNGTDTTITNTTGKLILDNTDNNDEIIARLGSDDGATSFQVQNNSGTSVFSVAGNGYITQNIAKADLYVSSASATASVTPGSPINIMSNSTTAAGGITSNDFTIGTNGRLTYTGTETKVFDVEAICSMTTGSNTRLVSLFIAKNAAVIANSEQRRYVSTGADVGNMSVGWTVSLATNDYVEVHVDVNTATTVTPETCRFKAVQELV